jgi:hypothetical protein
MRVFFLKPHLECSCGACLLWSLGSICVVRLGDSSQVLGFTNLLNYQEAGQTRLAVQTPSKYILSSVTVARSALQTRGD